MISRKPVVGQRKRLVAEPPPLPPSRLGIWRQRVRRLGAPLRSLTQVGMGIVIALVALFVFSTLNPGPPRLSAHDVDNEVAKVMASATPPPAFSSLVYAQIAPSIVQVDTRFIDKGEMSHGRGTGVVLDEQGSILTSLHVVKDSLGTQVTFADGTQSDAETVATQPEKDIAVIRAVQPPAKLIPATLGNPKLLHPGDDVVAVGNPFGLSNSVTVGHVSGLERTFLPPNNGTPIQGLIQFDAAVNPGNSGGPLLNRDGEVVAVVTGLVNPTGQDVFIGIGFAVPIDVAAAAAGTPPY